MATPKRRKHHGFLFHMRLRFLEHMLKEVEHQLELHGADMLPEPYRTLVLTVENALKAHDFHGAESALLKIAQHLLDKSAPPNTAS